MFIAFIIAGSVVLVTFGAGFFDYLGKKQLSQGQGDAALAARVAQLEQKLAEHEQAGLDRDEAVRKLEAEVSFMTNLLSSRNP